MLRSLFVAVSCPHFLSLKYVFHARGLGVKRLTMAIIPTITYLPEFYVDQNFIFGTVSLNICHGSNPERTEVVAKFQMVPKVD